MYAIYLSDYQTIDGATRLAPMPTEVDIGLTHQLAYVNSQFVGCLLSGCRVLCERLVFAARVPSVDISYALSFRETNYCIPR